MNVTRRGFGRLALSGAASAAGLLAARKIPIAVQLYSVRQIAAKDLAGVLQEVKKLGYDGVEFAGYYDHSAQEVRKMLDANGLKVAGTHTALDLLTGDKLRETLDINRTIGNKNIIVPSMPKKYSASIEGWKEAGKLFSELAAKLKPEGFVIGYHNHRVEFEKQDGVAPFDAFFGAARKDVKVQLDIGHAQRAGADPVEVIKRYKGRIVSVHVKEYAPDREDAPLGEGLIKWNDVFKALDASGGFEWFITEEEAKTCTGFECIQTAIQRLRKMRA